MLFGENVTNIAMKTKELIKTSTAYDDVLKPRNAFFSQWNTDLSNKN